MEWIAAIQQAITYIEDHLLDEINYEDVAKHIYISSHEFHRAFSFLTGITATTYIRNRRLSLAARDIIETDEKITDIAFKYGYESPESFTKAFTRFHGIAPKYARDESTKLKLFNPFIIKLTVEGGKCMDYRIVQTENLKFISIVRSFSNDIVNDDENHDIPDFWTECQNNELITRLCNLRPIGKRDVYGLCSPAKEGEDSFNYGIGILMDEDTQDINKEELEDVGYHIWDVKGGTYVVFECIGKDANSITETWSKFYKEFLPQMGYEAEMETDYEVYFENGNSEVFCELWIPIRRK